LNFTKYFKDKRLTSTYVRHGTLTLQAALNTKNGEITYGIIDSNNAINFLKFLKKIYKKYKKTHIHLIMDNLSIHKQKDVLKWLESKINEITVHYTPTYSSWTNQVEIWFNRFTKDVIKDGVWKSKNQIINQIVKYISAYNVNYARPYKWKYDGEKRKQCYTFL